MNTYHIEFDLNFKRNTFGGLYVAFEGIDGAGKTAQAEKAARFFKEQGKVVEEVSEPRRTGSVGRLINEILQGREKLPAATIQHLICADRIAQIEDFVIPSLKQGKIILSHRCFWSSIPYGIMDRSEEKYNVNTGNILMVAQSILSLYHQILIPDKTFYLDVPARIAANRIKKLETKKEYYETEEKLEKIRKGYEWMIRKFPKEFIVIDGEKSVEEVTDAIVKCL